MNEMNKDELRQYLTEVAADPRDVPLLMAMARQESGFNPRASAGTTSAKGLFQFTDPTWADYGSGGDVFNWQHSADAAARLVKTLRGRILAQYPDAPPELVDRAVTIGYHAGSGLPAEQLMQAAQGDYEGGIRRPWWKETKQHVGKVMGYLPEYAGEVHMGAAPEEQVAAGTVPGTVHVPPTMRDMMRQAIPDFVPAALPVEVPSTGSGGGGSAGSGGNEGVWDDRESEAEEQRKAQEKRRRELAEAGGMALEAFAKIFARDENTQVATGITPARPEILDPWAAANAYFRSG